MTRTRLWLILFSGLAFVASGAALYVHYNLIINSSYTSFCDISETVSCEAVYSSAYGTVRGVPVAAGGMIWAALVLLLVARGMRPGLGEGGKKDEGGKRIASRDRRPAVDPAAGATAAVEYVFVLSIVGLATVLYLGYASYFVLHKVCLLCAGTYVGVFGVFFVAAGVTTMPFGSLPGRLFRDLRSLPASPAAAGLGLVWLVASIALVAFFPRDMKAASASGSAPGSVASSATPAATPAPTPAAASATGTPAPTLAETPQSPAAPSVMTPKKVLTPAQRSDFERWFVAQPYTPLAIANDGAKVVIVKFNDYMCPPCRQTYMNYKGVLAKFASTMPGQVKFVTRDFPLEAECNTGGPHLASCEAAAAVRMARAKGKAEALEDWLFDNQPAMTPDLVRQGVKQVAGVMDFDARYPAVLEQVKADVKYGQSLGVGRTPTFFINGRKVEGGVDPEFFEAAIEYELARAAQQGSKP